MTGTRISPWLIAAVMLCGAALAFAAKPRARIADQAPPVLLEQLVPKQFGTWQVDESVIPVVVDPQTQAALNQIYNQTLARTYVDAAGQRIMLSIAYGGDQSDAMQVHRPEICYAAQGFHVVKQAIGQLATDYGMLPVKRLVAVQGQRNEPITYWVVVGDTATELGFRQKLQQLKYGLTGRVPDGMLVRVSSIDRNDELAYGTQERFLREMLAAMPDASRARIAGRFGA